MSDAPPHALLRPRIAVPFLTISLIWGSTWVVIVGQIASQPPAWSVVWRFVPATCGVFVLALVLRSPLRIGWNVHGLAALLGLCQFSGNYMLVYHSEQHLTSGIVAVMSALLIVPNALLGRLVLGQQMTPRFMAGSAIAIAGIALLLVNEGQGAGMGDEVWPGVLMALGAMVSASIAGVIQAGETGRSVPMASLLAWAMAYGTLFDAAIARVTEGPPVFPVSPSFWAGTLYLAFLGSVVTFPLYWGLVREIGPGRAAYHGVLVVIIAMSLSTLFEGYVWTVLAISGSALSLAGLVIALRARSPM